MLLLCHTRGCGRVAVQFSKDTVQLLQSDTGTITELTTGILDVFIVDDLNI